MQSPAKYVLKLTLYLDYEWMTLSSSLLMFFKIILVFMSTKCCSDMCLKGESRRIWGHDGSSKKGNDVVADCTVENKTKLNKKEQVFVFKDIIRDDLLCLTLLHQGCRTVVFFESLALMQLRQPIGCTEHCTLHHRLIEDMQRITARTYPPQKCCNLLSRWTPRYRYL